MTLPPNYLRLRASVRPLQSPRALTLVALLTMCVAAVRAQDFSDDPGSLGEPDNPSNHPLLLGPLEPGDAFPLERVGSQDDSVDEPVGIRPILYDIATKTVRLAPRGYRDGLDGEPRAEPEGEGGCAPADPRERGGGVASVFGADGRDEISNTTVTPWNRIGKVYVWFHDPADDPETSSPSEEVRYADGSGSGALIGECHVLTAGHVIYNHDPGDGNIGWAEKIIFVPGLYTDSGGETRWPYGSQYATEIMSFRGWTQDEDENHDMGFFVLDTPIGATTGWFGYSTRDSNGATRNISGYPGDRNNGLDQFHMAGQINCENRYNLKYKIDTFSGQSGAPVWRYDGSSRLVVGVHAHGNVAFGCGFETQNRGVRITSGKFDAIQDWKAEYDCPAAMPDLADDGGDDEPGPDRIITMRRIPIDLLIRNLGVRAASRFRVAAFLSADDVITRDDVFLGVANVPDGLGCFEGRSVEIDGVIPADIEAGVYYLGWFIDPDGLVDESDEESNRHVLTSTEVVVQRPDDIVVRPRIRRFLRGDANDDSRFDISDALRVVGHLFLGEPPPGCLRAADNNEDGRVDLSDAIDGLTELFIAPSRPRACGEGRAPRALGCGAYSHCQ